MLEVSSGLSKEIMKDIKLILVDFIYKFKDKKYKYICENRDVYCVFEEVIDFIRSYQLKPSLKLQEEYKQTPINHILFPDFEVLQKEIGISEELYSNMKEE